MKKIYIAALSMAIGLSEDVASIESVIEQFDDVEFHQPNQNFHVGDRRQKHFLVPGIPVGIEDLEEAGLAIYRVSFVSYGLKLTHVIVPATDPESARRKAGLFHKIYDAWAKKSDGDSTSKMVVIEDPLTLADINKLSELVKSQESVLLFSLV